MKNQQKSLLVIGVAFILAACCWLLIRPLTESSDDKVDKTTAVAPGEQMAKDPEAFPGESNMTSHGVTSAETSQPSAQQLSHQTSPQATSSYPEGELVDANMSKKEDLTGNNQEEVKTSPSATNPAGESQSQAAQTPAPGVAFPGIKQEMGDVMLAQISHQPGSDEDSFVAIFQRVRGQGEFNGSVWIIADYVQRGTTEMMAMPSHADLHLTPQGAPKNPRTGARLVLEGAVGSRLSKRFTIKRPGFEGEELSGVRVGIFDRALGNIHIAKVSATQWNKKRSLKRARVGVP